MATVVCVLVHGAPGYYAAGAEAARSVLRHTPFQLFVAHDAAAAPAIPASPRLRLHPLGEDTSSAHRAQRFLQKFHALAACLSSGTESHVLLLDADAVFVRRCSEPAIRRALGTHPIAMVEQPSITGSTMGRASFLEHFVRHTLSLLAPGAAPPALSDFRFFNSGVVLATRSEAEAITTWALATMAGVAGDHQVGDHMIADQDYFQLWTNTVHPRRAATLPWYWNHCEYWHTDFPRLGTLIAHFSNFCHGPTASTPERMRALQAGRWHWTNRAAGAWTDVRRRSA